MGIEILHTCFLNLLAVAFFLVDTPTFNNHLWKPPSPGAAVRGRQLTACLAADQLGLGQRSERQRDAVIESFHLLEMSQVVFG